MRMFVAASLLGFAACLGFCPSAAAKVYYVLGAEDDEDEDVGVLHEIGIVPGQDVFAPDVEEEPLPPERPRRRRFALRVGALVTTSAGSGWETGYSGELAYEGRSWEAGVEVSQVEDSKGEVRSLLIAARAGYLLKMSSGLRAFVSGGAIAERGELLTLNEKGSPWAGILTVGAGYAKPEAAWELRVSYNVILGSTNASGSVLAGAGLRF